ncbi:MAG TPA: PadR family transcriptional regulator [Bacteroidia bacterium]|nr:PadR family transcriptional regulator [Bacteroidia bacterium]
MSEKNENIQSQMRKGVLELCILSILEKGDAYPTEILEELKDAKLLVVEGTIYPLLNRLKDSGYLTYHWKESNQGPPRKYYHLTSDGKKFLKELIENWDELVKSVNKIIKK